ncbi:hypothetical protein FOCC_FOCC005355 [Frankliniella occidentalis]|nr:hypothetical protein FOCC_FOCC005355 [Frankliniella occidentalis]
MQLPDIPADVSSEILEQELANKARGSNFDTGTFVPLLSFTVIVSVIKSELYGDSAELLSVRFWTTIPQSHNLLFYYDSQSCTRPSGVVMLEGCYCERLITSGSKKDNSLDKQLSRAELSAQLRGNVGYIGVSITVTGLGSFLHPKNPNRVTSKFALSQDQNALSFSKRKMH